ncbi:CLUMA_CG019001, isoform A [Clunio marinus]|uniref:CLUMA_CG019001, isoform A n=1 Tax=Clunio marinus TaxID=568069 RepID=A0A1J1J390_9DIPT|nr:CLUMA_CG019001, isoform A [Clunio marinus]
MKSDVKSQQLRTEANRLYVHQKFYDALLKYNESLCAAESESENMGLAFANRSAVYFEMKLYDKCLSNIELAKKNCYPEKNLEILKKRENKCLQLLKQNDDANQCEDFLSSFELSYPGNDELPFIANCLEMEVDSKYGRYIVTKRHLKVGDIVAIDEPTFKVIKADSRYSTCYDSNVFQRCGGCMKENLLGLIPCTSCCRTMYCSIDCMKSSHKRHHKYECEIVDELLTSGIMHIVVRMLLEGLSLFDGDIHEMEKFLTQHTEPMTIFNLNSKSWKSVEGRRKMFLAALSLPSCVSDEKVDLENYENIFMKTKKLKGLWNSNESFIRKILVKLVHVGTHYVHGIGGWSLNQKFNEEEPKNPSFYQQLNGNGLYLFCSLLNHSCAPNIKRLNVDDKVVVIVSRPIEKGEQLFDSYRPNFNNQAKTIRQEALMKDYGFVCDCEACYNDWPLNHNLNVFSEELLEFAWGLHEELPFMTVADAKKMLYKCYDAIAQHHEHFPSAELIVLQECVSNCLILITKPSLQFP